MRKLIFGILLLVVVGIGLLHIFTPGELVFYHDTYRRLSYFPIAVGAILFGVTGGLTLAVLTSLAFIPHILLYMGAGPDAYLSELTEVLLYIAVAVVIGFIASKERRLREEYERLSERLKRSYAKLHSETELLIEVEEQLKASQKLSILGQLSASLAHEIKNPLGSIKGTAEILLDDFPKSHPKHEFVKILIQEVDRLNTSVDEVLLFSRRPQNIEQENNRESLAKIVRRVYTLTQNRMEKKKLSFKLTDVDACEDCLVEGHRYSQVLLNIVLNAVDAVHHNGRVEIACKKNASWVVVSISDDGPGVADADLKRVFEPFYSRKETGTGLGLSISKKIVESYGGKLDIKTSRWGGACFSVWVPLSSPDTHGFSKNHVREGLQCRPEF
jgi:signal transduction histidine kinase